VNDGREGTAAALWAHLPRRVREFLDDLAFAGRQWYRDNTFEMGAALAFYAVFAFTPLLVLAIALASALLGGPAARGELHRDLQVLLGQTIATAMESLLQEGPSKGGSVPTWISVAALLIGATGFFGQLQQSLNAIWKVRPKAGRGIWGIVRDRAGPYLMILVGGVVIVAFLLLHAALAVADRLVPSLRLPGGLFFWTALDWVVSFLFFTVLFALVYKLLPDVRLTWRDVWEGAALTAVLFLIGNGLIALYLSLSGVGSAYGAAGSAVVFLLWVFYSAQLVLFGAEFTQALAARVGRRAEPKPNAEPLPQVPPAA
jgi:membrane protein